MEKPKTQDYDVYLPQAEEEKELFVREKLKWMITEVAPIAKEHINMIARRIAFMTGSRLVEAPIKDLERSVEKVIDWHGWDPEQITDLARCTIITASANLLQTRRLLESTCHQVREVTADSNPYGYSGIIANIMTPAHVFGEIQANTPDMIYFKEPKDVSMRCLGEELYNQLDAYYDGIGGKGHLIYRQARSMKRKTPEYDELTESSRRYYANIRR